MTSPLAFDYYCCQGGASKGLHDAGYRVIGIDRDPQPNYPYEFVQADALEHISRYGHLADLRAASPPCQFYSDTYRINSGQHEDLIALTRAAFEAVGGPYVIENVEAARPHLRDPIMLCGAYFGKRTYRHRLFESNVPLWEPTHLDHLYQTVKMGRPLREGDWYHAVGNFSGVDYVRRDMGVPWMNRDGIRECIPPAYAEFVGRQLLLAAL